MSQTQPDRESKTSAPPGIPRWLKISGIIVIVLILLVAIIFAFDIGGQHGPDQFGPGQHGPSGDAGGETLSREDNTQQP
jgi:hypothetical protein